MTAADIIRFLGSAAFAAVLVAVINAVTTRRKLGSEASRTDAETDKIITETARGLVSDLRVEAVERAKHVAQLTARVDDLEQGRDSDRTKISSLERQLEAMIRDRDAVVLYVSQFRVWVSSGAKPPPPRVPVHLRDVIPEWSPDDHDRSTDRAAPVLD